MLLGEEIDAQTVRIKAAAAVQHSGACRPNECNPRALAAEHAACDGAAAAPDSGAGPCSCSVAASILVISDHSPRLGSFSGSERRRPPPQTRVGARSRASQRPPPSPRCDRSCRQHAAHRHHRPRPAGHRGRELRGRRAVWTRQAARGMLPIAAGCTWTICRRPPADPPPARVLALCHRRPTRDSCPRRTAWRRCGRCWRRRRGCRRPRSACCTTGASCRPPGAPARAVAGWQARSGSWMPRACQQRVRQALPAASRVCSACTLTHAAHIAGPRWPPAACSQTTCS